MIWFVIGLTPMAVAWTVAIVAFVRHKREKPPPVAVLESRAPREAVRDSMRKSR